MLASIRLLFNQRCEIAEKNQFESDNETSKRYWAGYRHGIWFADSILPLHYSPTPKDIAQAISSLSVADCIALRELLFNHQYKLQQDNVKALQSTTSA